MLATQCCKQTLTSPLDVGLTGREVLCLVDLLLACFLGNQGCVCVYACMYACKCVSAFLSEPESVNERERLIFKEQLCL